jgi:EpsI family protein
MRLRQIQWAGVFALLMACATVLAWAWKPTHFIADHKPPVDLETLIPKAFGEWAIDPTIVPLLPAPDLEKVIAETYDQVLARTYRNAHGDRIMLAIAYGRNQNEGMNTHRPEICYPAQGLPIVAGSSTVAEMPFQGKPVKLTKLVAASSARIEPITYWLIVGDEITTYGRGHKLVTLEYGLRGQIPDGMLVRISSIDPEATHGFAQHAIFINQMLDAMTPAARLAVLGRSAPPV